MDNAAFAKPTTTRTACPRCGQSNLAGLAHSFVGEPCSQIPRPDLTAPGTWPVSSHAWWLQWRSIWITIAAQYSRDVIELIRAERQYQDELESGSDGMDRWSTADDLRCQGAA